MFLQQKYKNTLLLGFSLLLIAYFIGIRAFFLVHQFSHHADQNFQQVSISKSDSKSIITKNTAQKPENKDDCLICYLVNLYQNNILLVAAGSLLMMSFVLVNNFIPIKNFKILPLLFSYQTRAPPVNF